MSETTWLKTADESGDQAIVKTIRLPVGRKSTHGGVRLLLDFFRLVSLRRNDDEIMRHWTRRFTLQYTKVGQALNTSTSQSTKDFLHENIRGILLSETSGLASSEFESVLATSTVGNSLTLRMPSVHNGVMPRWQREFKSQDIGSSVAAVDTFDRSRISH